MGLNNTKSLRYFEHENINQFYYIAYEEKVLILDTIIDFTCFNGHVNNICHTCGFKSDLGSLKF